MLKKFHVKRFAVQLVLIFLLFTLGTVITLGVPAAILFQRQTNAQIQRLIEQTNQTALAMFNNQTAQIKSLAKLLAARPTLNQLLLDVQDDQSLAAYLGDFIENSDIDGAALCDRGVLAASAGETGIDAVCFSESGDDFIKIGETAWLIAQEPMLDDPGVQVVVGQSARGMLDGISAQTGMDFVLFYEGGVLVDRSPMKFDAYSGDLLEKADLGEPVTMMLNTGQVLTYQPTLVQMPLPDAFEAVGLLNIDDLVAVNRQLRLMILGALLAVSLIGTLVAVILSKRISYPLNQLARSAASLREGDLSTPFKKTSRIWEIDQLTNALEDARVGLKHSLDQLQKDKVWIEHLLNAIVEGLLTVDENNRITYLSEAAESMLGVEAPHVLGFALDEFFTALPGEDSFSRQVPPPNQTRRIPALVNGREVLFNVSTSSVVPPEAGNAARALVIRDVTDEERIHKLIGEFMANITHEFRTPLSALSASVELLVEELPELTTEETSTLLNALHIGIIDLQSLIDNLIEAASIEAGRFKVNPQEVELDAITDAAANTIQPILRKHGVTLIQPEMKQRFLVMADRRRTSQALLNLLSNALKYSPEGGRIMIRTFILGNEVVIEVQDEGGGVNADRQEQLFHRFVSPEPDGGMSGISLGLGLSVVKAVIEAQGGKVGYRAGDPGGAVFWFTLPLVVKEES